jgi:hypothetical protein
VLYSITGKLQENIKWRGHFQQIYCKYSKFCLKDTVMVIWLKPSVTYFGVTITRNCEYYWTKYSDTIINMYFISHYWLVSLETVKTDCCESYKRITQAKLHKNLHSWYRISRQIQQKTRVIGVQTWHGLDLDFSLYFNTLIINDSFIS